MPSPSDRDSWLYVEDMRTFCERVLEYTRDVERDAFTTGVLRCDAIRSAKWVVDRHAIVLLPVLHVLE